MRKLLLTLDKEGVSLPNETRALYGLEPPADATGTVQRGWLDR